MQGFVYVITLIFMAQSYWPFPFPFHYLEFDLHENGPLGGTCFHRNGFAGRVLLFFTHRQKLARKWPVENACSWITVCPADKIEAAMLIFFFSLRTTTYVDCEKRFAIQP